MQGLGPNHLPGHVAGTSALPPTADLRVSMSRIMAISSASPSGADLASNIAECLFLTRRSRSDCSAAGSNRGPATSVVCTWILRPSANYGSSVWCRIANHFQSRGLRPLLMRWTAPTRRHLTAPQTCPESRRRIAAGAPDAPRPGNTRAPKRYRPERWTSTTHMSCQAPR